MPKHHAHNQFLTRKTLILSKRDKSSAGRIDPRAITICSAINSRSEYYTTSSCSGRCFLYVGDGIKSCYSQPPEAATDEKGAEGASAAEAANKLGFFKRYRVSHERIDHPSRYFNLQTLLTDPTGGSGDPVPSVGQFDGFGNNAAFRERLEKNGAVASESEMLLV